MRCAGKQIGRRVVAIAFGVLLGMIAGPVAAQSPEAGASNPPPTETEGRTAEPRTLDSVRGSSDAGKRDHEARQLFELGRLAFEDGRFDDALQYFQRAYELSDRPQLLFNIGAAFDRQRRNAEALEQFERYLQEVPNAPNRREVEARIPVLKAAIAEAAQAEALRQERDRLLADQQSADEDDEVVEKWWFWTGIGAAVAGGVLAAVLLSSGDDLEDPLEGNVSGVTFTLGSP